MKKEVAGLFFFNGSSLKLPDSIGLLFHITQVKKCSSQSEPAEIFLCTVSILLKSLRFLRDFMALPNGFE